LFLQSKVMIVFFVGYMASGKSTLGKRVAKRLSLPFFDMDKEIEKTTKITITEIFKTQGEEAFRHMETEFLNSFIQKETHAILSTGGGTPCFNNNIELLNNNGLTVYLKRPAKELANRIHNSKKSRPLVDHLNLEELEKFIETHLSGREKYYLKSELNVSRDKQSLQNLTHLLQPYLDDEPEGN
jgi:shikimate kinase